jgi:hypothetical protein
MEVDKPALAKTPESEDDVFLRAVWYVVRSVDLEPV